MNLIDKLKREAPKAWEEFDAFIHIEKDDDYPYKYFFDCPFEMQAGVFIKYLYEQYIIISCEIEKNILQGRLGNVFPKYRITCISIDEFVPRIYLPEGEPSKMNEIQIKATILTAFKIREKELNKKPHANT